jgi:hypothetical protein
MAENKSHFLASLINNRFRYMGDRMKQNKSVILLAAIICALLMGSCITVTQTPRETDFGSHHVTVLPACQNASTHSQRNYESDGTSKILFYEFKCGETTVRLDGNALTVNGKSYGSINEGDTISVHYGNVTVNSTARVAK